MSTQHLNIFARDSRNAGSLAGREKSTLETLEHHLLSQYKNNGNPPISTCARVFPTECAKKRVQVFHRVIFLTGGGFQPNSYRVRSCSSRGKAALHIATYKRKCPFEGYEVKND